MVKNPPANAGDTSLIPDPGKPDMLGSNKARGPQLSSLSSSTWERQRLKLLALEPMLHREATAMRSLCTKTREQRPFTATRKSQRAATKTKHSQKQTFLEKVCSVARGPGRGNFIENEVEEYGEGEDMKMVGKRTLGKQKSRWQ